MMNYKVFKWVPDQQLEDVLNAPGLVLVAMFRNQPGRNGGVETTTVVMRDIAKNARLEYANTREYWNSSYHFDEVTSDITYPVGDEG